MSCSCLENAATMIKDNYKNLHNQAAQAYIQGDQDKATEYYQKAFNQIRVLLRLPQIPCESIQYLITACSDCVDYCKSEEPIWSYLQLAIKDLQSVIKAEEQSVELRTAAMEAYIQMSSCLIFHLESSNEYIDVNKTIYAVEQLWKKHSPQLAVIH